MNIVNLLSRLFARRAMNWGMRKGTDAFARRGTGAATGGKMTPAALKQAKDMRQAVKRARMAARVTRRLGR